MEVSAEDFREHCDNNDGYCTVCKDFTRDGLTEPDAENLHCQECDGMTCVGAEQALLMDLVSISEDEE